MVPSLEQVRFTNSGLEATLLAIRLGMAYTRRPGIAKFAGHYHGGHEHVLVSTHPVVNRDGPIAKTSESLALPDYYVEHTEVLPFDDIDRCEALLRQHREEVGVVVVEPFQSGYIPVDRDFMQRLRLITQELGMVLLFDEVKTGFRIRLGGAQAFYGVRPDLTALGKVLGGGFPVGAVGGRQEILELASPERNLPNHEVVFHSGTFNGNPVSLLAGLRTLEFLETPGVYETLLDTTRQLRENIEQISAHYGLPVQTVGEGTIFNVVFPGHEVGRMSKPSDVIAAEMSARHRTLRKDLDFLLMKHGVFSKPYNRFSMSTAHDDKALASTLDAFEQSFAALGKQQS